jgi:hypothetical protein
MSLSELAAMRCAVTEDGGPTESVMPSTMRPLSAGRVNGVCALRFTLI